MNYKIKVLWLGNSLGLAVNQTNFENSTLITPYYFWPRTDAWGQLKTDLSSKLWINEQEKIIVLNRVSDLMNYWQENRKIQNLERVKKIYTDIDFVGVV